MIASPELFAKSNASEVDVVRAVRMICLEVIERAGSEGATEVDCIRATRYACLTHAVLRQMILDCEVVVDSSRGWSADSLRFRVARFVTEEAR